MLHAAHAAGQAFKSVFFGGGPTLEKEDEEEPVDLDTVEDIRSEEPGTYWSEEVSRKVVNEVLATPPPRQPNYRTGDIVKVARPLPNPSESTNMTRPHKASSKQLGFKPHNSIDDPINKITLPLGSFKDATRARRPTTFITSKISKESHHSSTFTSSSSSRIMVTETGPPNKRRKVEDDRIPSLDLEMTGLEKPSRISRSANGSLESQKDHMKHIQRAQKSKARNTNEDENMGDGFDVGVNVDDNDDVKPVMTQNGLSPPIRSQTISGDSHSSRPARSSKNRPRDREGTLRSISATLNGNHAGDASMEEHAPTLPLRHKRGVVSEPEQSEAGQAVEQPEDDDDEDGDMMKTTKTSSYGGKIALLRSFHDVHGNKLCEQGVYIYMNKIGAQFEVLGQSSREPLTVPFSRILKYTTGVGGNGVACMLEGSKVLAGTTAHMDTYWVGLIFRNHEGLRAFKNAMAMIGSSIKHFQKAEDTIKKTIEKKWTDQLAWRGKQARKEEKANTPNASETLQRSGRHQAQMSPAADTLHPKTPKLRNQMQADGDATPTTTKKELRSADSGLTPTINESSSRPRRTLAAPTTAYSDTDSSTPPARATRSSGRSTTNQTSARKLPAKQDPTRTPFDDTEYAGCPWKSALLYPSKGPGRATVEFEDLHRLDDEAYLNDNLISFGLRYLQENYPATKSKVYIFNSFFYTTLAGKGRREIDYDAVKRWTSKVDLFSYDHVVVPINAGMHWYWAIICNIRNVFRDSESDAKQDSMVDEQAEKLDELSITTEQGEAARSTPRKNDPTAPTIVTLDSLHNPHSPVTVNLRKYVAEEAKNKKGKEVDQSFIKGKGMTSKEIPSQQNLTDCGLHLIITIGELLKSPDEFVAKLIGKSFDNEKDFAGWEDMSEYREHWKKIVLNEYDKQTGGEYSKEVAKAKVVFDQKRAKARAKLDHARKLEEAQASKANRPFVPLQTPGRLPISTSTTTPATSARQRSMSPSKSAPRDMSTIHTRFKTPIKPEQPVQLAKTPLHDFTSDSEEDVQPSIVRPNTTEMQRNSSPPTSSHVTDKLAEHLNTNETIAESENPSFIANSQPEADAILAEDGNVDELEIIPNGTHHEEAYRRRHSQSPAKQAIVSHTDLMEQDPEEPASSQISQTRTPRARSSKKFRESTPGRQSMDFEASQDVEQPPSISIDEHLQSLLRPLDRDHVTEATNRLSRANNVYDNPSPYHSSKGREDEIVLEISGTQDSDELGESQGLDGPDLLGASNGESGQHSRKTDKAPVEIVDLDGPAEVVEVAGQEQRGKRPKSPHWPQSPPQPSSPRTATPEL